MRKLYESAIAEMKSLLEGTIDNSLQAYEAYTMEPLFCVSNRYFTLMKNVAHFSNYQVLNGCRQLCIEMCRQLNLDVSEISEVKDVDFIIQQNAKKIGFLISFSSNYMPNVDAELMDSFDEFVVVVLQEATANTVEFYPPNSFKYKEYAFKNKIKNITVKQFFDWLGTDDYEDFKECVGRYNYEAEQMLGLTVSAIPTKKALGNHKIKIKNELLSYFYEDELRQLFKDNEICDMRDYFESNYKIMLSSANFAQSLISSEWYYNLQVMTDGGIEQTAIVAGYLKSLEQLLCSILLVLSDDDNNEFMFFTNKAGKEKTGKERLPLTRENQKLVLTMANNILKVIRANKKSILRKTVMTERVISYLEQYVDKTRNGYMHKDNLYEWMDIVNIRKKTYAAYFMVLGTFYIDVDEITRVDA